jgi:hypothetical protein
LRFERKIQPSGAAMCSGHDAGGYRAGPEMSARTTSQESEKADGSRRRRLNQSFFPGADKTKTDDCQGSQTESSTKPHRDNVISCAQKVEYGNMEALGG